MSAFVSPSATPSQAPERIVPQPSPVPSKHGFRKRWLVLVLTLAVIGIAAYLLRPKQQEKGAATAAIRTARIASGSLQRGIRVAGTTTARNFANITAPMMRGPDAGRALVLIFLAPSGIMVKKGDPIAAIDPQTIKDHVDDLHALVVQADADVRKRQAEQAIEMENLRQTVRTAKAQLEKARLDYSAQEIRMPIDQEQLKLSVEEAEATYKQVQQDLITTQALHRAQIRILELTRDRHARHRDRHKVDITKFSMKAPMDGLVVLQSFWRGGDMGQFQQGDQVSPGMPFMKIVDTNSMQVEASLNQVESEWVRIGQTVQVDFDAFPDLHLKGKVQSVGALAAGGWRQNYYIRNIPVKIELLQHDPRVIPDLSAGGNIIVEQKASTPLVPMEAVEEEGGKSYVFVKSADGSFNRREIQIGLRNYTQAAVLAGLSVGEEVALQPPPAAVPH